MAAPIVASRAGMHVRLEWNGDKLNRGLHRATLDAMNETMDEAVQLSKGFAPVRTGALRDSLTFHWAQAHGNRVFGRWGSFTIYYAFFQELGTINHAAHPFIAPAAQIAYPKLRSRIALKMRQHV